VVVMQNPRTDAEAGRLQEIVKEQRLQFQYSEAALIDVYSAFEQSGDVAALINPADGLHPNDAGERLWAQTTIDAFGIG
jgi:lysophospholipase L1-like esterase